MQVWMHQFLHLLAGGAHTAAVGLGTVWAEDILRVCQGQRQLAASGRTQKELGMRDMIVFHALDKPLFDGGLADDVFELHQYIITGQKYKIIAKDALIPFVFALKSAYSSKWRNTMKWLAAEYA